MGWDAWGWIACVGLNAYRCMYGDALQQLQTQMLPALTNDASRDIRDMHLNRKDRYSNLCLSFEEWSSTSSPSTTTAPLADGCNTTCTPCLKALSKRPWCACASWWIHII